MHPDTGALRTYADAASSLAQRDAIAAHLAGCAACQAELAALQGRGAAVAGRLATLDAQPADIPHPAQALARFQRHASAAQRRELPAHLTLWAAIQRSFAMTKQTFSRGWPRPLAFGAAALACLLIIFSIAPVRQAAADFLGVFRVRKFAIISIDQAQVEKLEGLANLASDGRFGQPTVVRQPGAETQVADVTEASRLAGFRVRTPASLPEGAALLALKVASGPALHYEMDRNAMQALLEATQVQGVKLPPVEKVVIDLDVPPAVTQVYTVRGGRFSILQVPSPQVELPPGLDMAAIGEAAFKYLGMPDADARRMAQTIDWSSTAVIPMPANVLQYREVAVDGVSGLLIEHRPSSGSRRASSLLWQRDGIIYNVATTDLDAMQLLQIADSLR
jgi:hypothetical protein